MELILYKNFSKKINSTKQPDDTVTSITTEAYMKQGTSLEAPVFLINGVDLDVTYAKWANRYYFVSDIVLGNNNIYEVHCSQDVLASHKADITGYTGYVEYCDTFYDASIPDVRLSMKTDVYASTNYVSLSSVIGQYGSVVVTVANGDTSAQVGFTSMYAIDDTNIETLSQYLYEHFGSLETLKNLFGNVSNAVVEAHWVPFHLNKEGNSITIGLNTVSGAEGGSLKPYTNTAPTLVTIDIPWHYNDWRDFSPYSVMEIYLPFYGMVMLDQSKFAGSTTMHIRYSFDPISGEILYNLMAGDWIGNYRCSVAVPIAIGQNTSGAVKGITEIVAGVAAVTGAVLASAGTGGLTAPVFGAMAGGIATAGAGVITSFSTEASGSGGNGGYASGNLVLKAGAGTGLKGIQLTLFAHKFSVTDDEEPESEFEGLEGNPWFKKTALSTLSGYVKCAGASISIDGLSNDREEINTWLNQGIFIE